jgi:hypothetical protein
VNSSDAFVSVKLTSSGFFHKQHCMYRYGVRIIFQSGNLLCVAVLQTVYCCFRALPAHKQNESRFRLLVSHRSETVEIRS